MTSNKFTFSSSRDKTESTRLSQRINENPKNLRRNDIKDFDFDEQDLEAKVYNAKCRSEFYENLKEKKEKPWLTPKTNLHAAKVLLHEACRLEQSYVTSNRGHIKTIIRDGYNLLIKQMESRFRIESDINFMIDTISALGVWFKEITGPSFGRRPHAILSIYYNYLEGANVDDYITAFDEVQNFDSGRIIELPKENESVHDKIKTFSVSAPMFEQTLFIAQSRELRQLVKLKQIKETKIWVKNIESDPTDITCTTSNEKTSDISCSTNGKKSNINQIINIKSNTQTKKKKTKKYNSQLHHYLRKNIRMNRYSSHSNSLNRFRILF
jgi:hypothetical protein